MNGLEAIKAMMEGRLVARWIYFGGGRVIYKIIDGNVFSKCSDHDESEYSVEDDFDFDDEEFDENEITWCQIYLYDIVNLQSILIVDDETA